MNKSANAFRTISEVADDLKVPQHVLRFWETRFPQIKPTKGSGGRRYYRPEDIALLRAIQHLLYGDGFAIRGVQKILKQKGARAIVALHEAGQTASLALATADESDATLPAAHERPDEEPAGWFGQPMPDARPAIARMETGSTAARPPDAGLARHLRSILAEIEDCSRILATARAP